VGEFHVVSFLSFWDEIFGGRRVLCFGVPTRGLELLVPLGLVKVLVLAVFQTSELRLQC